MKLDLWVAPFFIALFATVVLLMAVSGGLIVFVVLDANAEISAKQKRCESKRGLHVRTHLGYRCFDARYLK